MPARPLPYPVIAVGSGPGGPAEVQLVDAETGLTLHRISPYHGAFTGGVNVALGDFTGDGYPEVVVTPQAGGGPHVRVFDGKSGLPIDHPLANFMAFAESFIGGVTAAAGDFTGDGRADLAVAAGPGGGPHVRVFDGKSGQEVASFFAFEGSFTGGVRLAADNLTQGRRPELVVAAGPGGGPRVRVLDPVTFSPVAGARGDSYVFEGSFAGGVFVAAGDVSGDGVSDWVVGAGDGGGPRVRVIDGVGGGVVRDWMAAGDSERGGVRVGAAFVNDDAVADVVTLGGSGDAQKVRTFDGATGRELGGPVGAFAPLVAGHSGGMSLAAGNDPPPPYGSGTHPVGRNMMMSGLYLPGVPFSLSHDVIAHDLDPDMPVPTGTVTFQVWVRNPDGGAWRAVFDQTSEVIPVGPGRATVTVDSPGVGNPDETHWLLIYEYSGDSYFDNQGDGHGGGSFGAPAAFAPSLNCQYDGNGDVVGEATLSTGNRLPATTPDPVRYVDGVNYLEATDLGSGGFGDGWGLTRSWSSRTTAITPTRPRAGTGAG